MIGNIRIDYPSEVEYQSIEVDFNIRYDTGEWFYAPLLSKRDSSTVFSVWCSIRKVVWYKMCSEGMCITSWYARDIKVAVVTYRFYTHM